MLVSNDVQSDRVMLLLQESQHLLAEKFPVFIDAELSQTPRLLQPKNASGSFSLKWKRSVKQAFQPKEPCYKKRKTTKLASRSVKIDYYGG